MVVPVLAIRHDASVSIVALSAFCPLNLHLPSFVNPLKLTYNFRCHISFTDTVRVDSCAASFGRNASNRLRAGNEKNVVNTPDGCSPGIAMTRVKCEYE
jgi:hypothetical protein